MADVFISYLRAEREQCLSIYNKLVALELTVWFDAHLENGQSFIKEINDAATNAKCILVLWSPGAIQSDWVKAEALIGQQQGKLASGYVKEVNGDLPAPFNGIQTDNLIDFGGDDRHPGWLKILHRIGTLTGRPGIQDFSRLLADMDVNRAGQWAVDHHTDPLAPKAVPWVAELVRQQTSAKLDLLRGMDGLPRPVGSERFVDAAEEENWNGIADSKDYRDFNDHLVRWPDGRYAAECKTTLAELL